MRRPVRVGLLATSIHFGGIERVLLNLIRHGRPHVEFVPIVFTRTDIKDRTFFAQLDDFGIPYTTIYVNAFKPKYVNAAYNVRETIAALRTEPIDLIHSHGYRADVIAVLASKWLGVPVVSTCHGFIPNDRRLRVYNWLDVLLLRYFAAIIAVSGQMKRELVADGVDAAKVSVVTNAVSELPAPDREVKRRATRRRLNIADDAFVFGYAGRLSEEKGVDDLLKASQRLSGAERDHRVLLVGDGPQRVALERTASALGFGSRIHFAGFQSDTSDWYSAMDAFVLPSLMEGTPMALLEAMAYGLPVIATQVGGVPSVITNGHNGLLVPPSAPEDLRRAMQQVVDDDELRHRLSSGAVRSVSESHNVDAWAAQVHDVYASVRRSGDPR